MRIWSLFNQFMDCTANKTQTLHRTSKVQNKSAPKAMNEELALQASLNKPNIAKWEATTCVSHDAESVGLFTMDHEGV